MYAGIPASCICTGALILLQGKGAAGPLQATASVRVGGKVAMDKIFSFKADT